MIGHSTQTHLKCKMHKTQRSDTAVLKPTNLQQINSAVHSGAQMHSIWVARLSASPKNHWLIPLLYICMYVCMHVHMYVCMYVRTYVCIYIIPSLMHNSIIKQQLGAMEQPSVSGLISNGITN